MELIKIAEKCQSIKQNNSHEPFCLELFRHAIVEKNQVAWFYVHQQYFRLVYYWIAQLTLPDNIYIEDLVQETFLVFWRAYTPEKFFNARDLGSVLSYLKDCAVSSVIQARRTAQKLMKEEVGWQIAREQESKKKSLSKGEPEQIWQRIVERCKDEKELLVAHLTYLSSLKPRDILAQHPDNFENIQEVYRIQRNLLERLRRDPVLKFMHEKNES